MDALEFIDLGERTFDDDEVLAIVEAQLAVLLHDRRDWLLGKLYRLDVRERDIKHVLSTPGASPARGLAKLVIARQRERARVKASTRVDPLPYDDEVGDLSW